jgi:hypothetical protein
MRVEARVTHGLVARLSGFQYAASETLESTMMFLPPARRTTMSGR